MRPYVLCCWQGGTEHKAHCDAPGRERRSLKTTQGYHFPEGKTTRLKRAGCGRWLFPLRCHRPPQTLSPRENYFPTPSYRFQSQT